MLARSRRTSYGDLAARVTVLLDENGIVEELWRVEDMPSPSGR